MVLDSIEPAHCYSFEVRQVETVFGGDRLWKSINEKVRILTVLQFGKNRGKELSQVLKMDFQENLVGRVEVMAILFEVCSLVGM